MKKPAGIYCRGCGYDLSGIGMGKCPECARAFDAGDARTFDTRSRSSLRSRLTRRGFALAVLVVLMAAFFPHGYAEARLKFRRPGSAPVESVRVQLIAPDWVRLLTGLSYPGWTRHATGLKPSAKAMEFAVSTHRFTLKGVTTDGYMAARDDLFNPGQIKINGLRATPLNTDAILQYALPPNAGGVRSNMVLQSDSFITSKW